MSEKHRIPHESMSCPPDPARRRILRLAAAAGLAAPLGYMTGPRAEGTVLRRPIPSSGELLPAVGLGTSRVFDVGSEESERAPRREVLRVLAEVGNAMVDSSPMYGNAETVVGDLAAELGVRDRLFLATKVWIEGREQGIAQMERSMERLRSGRIDLMQIHNLLDWRTHLETLRAWKEQGRVRYIGVTHYHEGAHDDLERVLTAEALDFVQLNYSLEEPEAARRLLPLAAERGVAVIVNRPFAGGRMFGAVRGTPLPIWATELGCTSWAQVFLKFVLAHPAVTCAIPGTSKAAHLLDNLGAARDPLPDASQQARIRKWAEGL